MKNVVITIILTGIVFCSCKKNQEKPGEPGNPGNGQPVSGIADTLSNHLTFLLATKKQGNSPAGSGSASLKISLKDTLYLAGSLQRPVQILHTDTAQNVSGVWIQVQAGASTGGVASYYYEVPEVKDMEENDTISVIMIGMDTEGLQLPQTFSVKITPYDKNKQPLGEKTIPAKLDLPKVDLPGNGSACGLSLSAGEHWSWDVSYISGNGDYVFFNQPGKAFSTGGADIEGSCCNGNSKWPEFCQGEYQHNRTLHFNTYYTINFENFSFLSNGSFMRTTLEDSPVPWPAGSDFCSGGEGMTLESLKLTDYAGTWEVMPVNVPANAHASLRDDTHELRLLTTNSSGTGYGNPGGVIHQLDCNQGVLVLAQVNAGGSFINPIFKFYSRHRNGEPKWYHF